MIFWKRFFAVAIGGPFLVASLLYGCSSERPEASNSSGPLPTPGSADGCSVEDQVKECYVLVSVNDGVKSCLSATQRCRGGVWSACGAAGGTISGTNIGLGAENLTSPTAEGLIQTRTHLAAGRADASACANPCDPGCLGYDEDAGALTTDASLDSAGAGLVATPSGFVDKLLRDKNNGYGKDCERWETDTNSTGHVHSACQGDYYCSRHAGSTDGNCVQFGEGPTETHVGKLAGTTNGAVSCRDSYPDLTVGVPCGLAGQIIVPICNRGAAALASGTAITIAEGNLVTPTAPTNTSIPVLADPTSPGCPSLAVACTVTTTAALAPGSCTRVNLSACGFNGNKGIYVNANRAIRECVIRTHILGPPTSSHGPTSEQNDQYGCANNYSAFNASQLPACIVTQAPKTVTLPYNGACSPGQIPQWGQLAWNATTPSTTSIGFDVRTRARVADGGFGPWSPWATVGNAKQSSSPPDDPQVCAMGGPSPCPKNLYAPLASAGGPTAVRGEQLELRVNLNPVGSVGPTLLAYYLAYTCVDSE